MRWLFDLGERIRSTTGDEVAPQPVNQPSLVLAFLLFC
jgi:hypothetical protein